MNKVLKIFSAAVTLAMLVSSCISCSGNSPAQTSEAGTSAKTTTTTAVTEAPVDKPFEGSFFPDSNNVKLIGRTLTENDTLWLAQSASGIEFSFSGTKASVDIVGDSAVFGKSDSQARFAVYVNGERVIDEMLKDFQKTYDIFSSDEAQEVTVKILKLSESANSTFGIKNINVTSVDGISPTPEKDLKIEFIGDSITCAYGVDDEVKEHHFSTETEDATKSYAYKTAEKLNADYSMVCYSGHGILSGYTTDNKKPNGSQLVPDFYEQFCRTYGSSKDIFTETTPWDFSSFVPDYIVVNLGTNDASYTGGDKDKQAVFTEKYVEFLQMIRKDNPDSYIICTLGVMGADLYDAVEKAVGQYSSQTGDTKVSAFKLSAQDMNANGIAADWHPSEKSHEVAAEELSGYIKTLMN